MTSTMNKHHRRHERVNTLLWALRQCCPEAFCKPLKPLACDIDKEIAGLVGDRLQLGAALVD
jgi:hypothetical protein